MASMASMADDAASSNVAIFVLAADRGHFNWSLPLAEALVTPGVLQETPVVDVVEPLDRWAVDGWVPKNNQNIAISKSSSPNQHLIITIHPLSNQSFCISLRTLSGVNLLLQTININQQNPTESISGDDELGSLGQGDGGRNFSFTREL